MSEVEINIGVQILLQRMKDCPEEFAPHDKMLPKWRKILSAAMGRIAIEDNLSVLTDEEREMVEAGLKAAEREMFTQDVMKALSGETEREALTEASLENTLSKVNAAGIRPTRILTSANMVAQAQNILEEKLNKAIKNMQPSLETYAHKTYSQGFSVTGDKSNE